MISAKSGNRGQSTLNRRESKELLGAGSGIIENTATMKARAPLPQGLRPSLPKNSSHAYTAAQSSKGNRLKDAMESADALGGYTVKSP